MTYRLRDRLLEMQMYRCAVCHAELHVNTPVVKLDKSLPKNYVNSVALCVLCAERSANSASLLEFYELHQSGEGIPVKRPLADINPVSLKIFREHMHRLGVPLDELSDELMIKLSRGVPSEKLEYVAFRSFLVWKRRQHVPSPRAVSNKKHPWGQVMRLKLSERQNHRCAYCGCNMEHEFFRHPNYATFEHVQSLADGGTHAAANIVMACMVCNNTRGNLNMEAEKFQKWVLTYRDELENIRRRHLLRFNSMKKKERLNPKRTVLYRT